MDIKALFTIIEDRFSPIITYQQVEKGEILQHCNSINYNLYLVKAGALRSFYFQDGRDLTSHFALEYGIVGAADSIIKGKKSRYAIEALEKSDILIMDFRIMEEFLTSNQDLERVVRACSMYLYIDLVERLEGLTLLSAEEKYNQLLERYPKIDQRVNLGHIASFLGMSQETLSRVRSRK